MPEELSLFRVKVSMNLKHFDRFLDAIGRNFVWNKQSNKTWYQKITEYSFITLRCYIDLDFINNEPVPWFSIVNTI